MPCRCPLMHEKKQIRGSATELKEYFKNFLKYNLIEKYK